MSVNQKDLEALAGKLALVIKDELLSMMGGQLSKNLVRMKQGGSTEFEVVVKGLHTGDERVDRDNDGKVARRVPGVQTTVCNVVGLTTVSKDEWR